MPGPLVSEDGGTCHCGQRVRGAFARSQPPSSTTPSQDGEGHGSPYAHSRTLADAGVIYIACVIAPFVLVEDLDVTMYGSLAALTGYVEATDVLNGVYEAFDAEGREVKLAASSASRPVTAEPGDVAGSRLRALLINYVYAIGPARAGVTDPDLATVDLASIVRTLWALHTGGRSHSW